MYALLIYETKSANLARFLLVQLHFDSLAGMRSPKAVRTALKTLPKGSGGYDDAYDEAMERIQGQFSSFPNTCRTGVVVDCLRKETTDHVRASAGSRSGDWLFRT